MAGRRPKGNKKLRLLLYLVSFLCLAAVCRQGYSVYQIKREQQAAELRITRLREQQQALEAERSSLEDPRYIEKLARENYNMVGKDEVPIFVVEDKR